MNSLTQTVIVIILTTGTLLTGGCASEEEKKTPAPVAVRTDLPEYRALAERIDYLGQVHATLEIQTLSQLQGSIVSIIATDGERVRKGTELVRLSVPDLEAAVERLRAERDYWCQRHAEDERLLERNAVPADQVKASQRACASAEAALREAESRRAKAVEYAPFDGIILRRFAEAGQNVMPGQPLLLIGNNEREIRVDVVEEDLRRGITVGMKAMLSINGTRQLPAIVSEISATSAPKSRTYTVTLRSEELRQLDARHGTSAPVSFLIRSKDSTLAVPADAIADREGDPHVFLLRNGRAYRQDVQPGIEDGDWVEVALAWNGSDAVAVSNLGSLKDDVAVFPVRRGEAGR